MAVSIAGPDWSISGLDQRSGMYPLQVESHILNSVDRLVPGLSSVTRYARYYALYAALAAHAEKTGLDAAGCRRLVRRSEVLVAAASIAEEESSGEEGPAHGVDGVHPFVDDGLDLAAAADEERLKKSYSPRPWGFWAQYGGPNTALGTVELDDRALRPGRWACPGPVRELFAPVFAASADDRLPGRRLRELRPVAIQAADPPENPWLCGLFTATRADGIHVPEDWEVDDRRRRSAFRMLGRTTELYGDRSDLSWDEAVKSAVAFGDGAENDPVLAGIPEIMGWRGLLLRHYSVNAWRRLWAGLVSSIGGDGSGDSSRDDLRAWLADSMPPTTLRTYLDDLPPTTRDGYPAPAEQQLLQDGDRTDQLVNVGLLLLGTRRASELADRARTVFLGKPDILNPEWVARQVDDFIDRPVRDFAVRLVDDMLNQAQRVALTKMRPDAAGRLSVFSRVHERNGRFFRTKEESSAEIGLRVFQLLQFAGQFGLVQGADDGTAWVTESGRDLLELDV
jgi:hypothetical protein